MRLFLLAFALILSFSPSAVIAADADDTTQSLKPEHELERLQTIFREIVEQTEVRIQQHAKSVAASNAEAARLSEELATAQQEIGQLTAALKEAEAAGTEAEGRIQQQSEAIADSNTEAARLSGELATAQEEIGRLTAALNEAEAAGTEAEKARAEAEARIEQQAQDIAASNAEAEQLKGELAEAHDDVEQLRAALSGAEAGIDRRTRELTVSEGELATALRDLEAAQEEIEQLNAAMNEAEANANQQEQVAEASNAEVARLNDELVTARQQMNELKSGLAGAQSTLKELDTEFNALGDAIVERIEQLFVAATLQTVVDVEQLRAKLDTTTELIDKLDKSLIAEGSQDVKSGELGSDDLTEFSTGVEPELIIDASESEN